MSKFYTLNGLSGRKFRAFLFGLDLIPEWFSDIFTKHDTCSISIGKHEIVKYQDVYIANFPHKEYYIMEGISGQPIFIKKKVFEGLFKYIDSSQEVL